MLMAEQNLPQPLKIADLGYLMAHGKIVFEGNAAQLYDNELVRKYQLSWMILYSPN